MTSAPTFSVVIPTYNEHDDIDATLRTVVGQSLPPLDIIVVDGGSADGTPARARAFGPRINVIDEGRRRGVAAARNTGIRAAHGDVVVILNADVLLPPGFLARLADVYAGDVDLLSVDSTVANLDSPAGRYIETVHRLNYTPGRVGWSEGFSCRRVAAIEAAFPEEIPGAGGEDVEFVERLLAAGKRWRVDYSIGVQHRVPGTLRGFWAQFRGRGRAIPHIEHALQGRRLAFVTAKRAAVLAKTLAVAALLLPHARHAWRLSGHSPRGRRDVPILWLTHHLMLAAHRWGEAEALAHLWRKRTLA